jgi:DNA-binding Xre family transcriptional regulator
MTDKAVLTKLPVISPVYRTNIHKNANILFILSLISVFFCYFAYKFKTLNMEHKDLNRLKIVLVEKKKTGTWLAEQLGVSYVTVSKWCSNITHPTLPTLDRIAVLLGCGKKDLIAD